MYIFCSFVLVFLVLGIIGCVINLVINLCNIESSYKRFKKMMELQNVYEPHCRKDFDNPNNFFRYVQERTEKGCYASDAIRMWLKLKKWYKEM